MINLNAMKTITILKKLLLILTLFCFNTNITAGSKPEDALSECRKLIRVGVKAMKEEKYIEALEIFTRAEALAEKGTIKKDLFAVKNNLGFLYERFSNYGEALGYFQQALTIAEDSSLKEKIPSLMSNIGLIYSHEKDYKTALEYFRKAYTEAKSAKNEHIIVHSAVNMCDVYNILGNYKEAEKYLMEVEKLPKPQDLEEVWKINLAECLLLQGKVIKGQMIIEGLLRDLDGQKTDIYVNVVQLLAKIYAKQGKTGQAILFAQQGLQNANMWIDKINLYDQLSSLYLQRKDYDIAFRYKDSVTIAKDSMSVLVNNGLLAANKVKLKVWDYQQEVKANKDKLAAERKLFYSILVTFITIVVLIIVSLRQKRLIAERNRQTIALEFEQEKNNHLLSERLHKEKETIALLEQERLKNEIEFRNRKLSSKALYLSDRNYLIEDVLLNLSKNPKLSKDKIILTSIQTLKSHLRTDEEWDNFIMHFEEVNQGFLDRLKEKHPKLTANDVKFITYVYMNLSTKEIAAIFNITIEACKKRKERVIAKMEISENINLFNYISGI
jgi:tetratricopeptide (TPR) repeat protein